MQEIEAGYYTDRNSGFQLHRGIGVPAWRAPQIGAIGELLSHWSLRQSLPALISLPTGAGKTAVGLAAPHIYGARRVLVVVPSTELRRQMVSAFRTQRVLRTIGALEGDANPTVVELTGRVSDWEALEGADVVVAHPNSISPVHYADAPPNALFDLVIVDEAHHARAPTWRAILEHFNSASAVLLTATPRRADGQKVPGEIVYHYPLRQALAERIFQPVMPVVLAASRTSSREELDIAIAEATCARLFDDAYADSAALIRASSVKRARELVALYEQQGLTVPVLHSGLGDRKQQEIIGGLRDGSLRAAAVVGMLVEGFDLPRLRIAAYHDKHKSLLPTAQLIGRLARVDPQFTQPSLIITANDVDVYPELKGALRELYEEDEDWAKVLPGILDDEIAHEIADRAYVRQFDTPPPALNLDAVHPLRRVVVREIPPEKSWIPSFVDGSLPSELQAGHTLRGSVILYVGLSPDQSTLILVTQKIERPSWLTDAGLDSPRYSLFVVSYRRSPRTDLPDLVCANLDNNLLGRELLEILGIADETQPANPTRLHEAFDSLNRISVSSVGVRATYGGTRGSPTYKIFSGSAVDRGLRDTDTAFGSVGHAIAQVADPKNSTYMAGMATAKGKYWETRYASLREYDGFITAFAERYWFPSTSIAGQLLPQVSRGARLIDWPSSDVIAVELDAALIGMGWVLPGLGPLERVELTATRGDAPGTIALVAELDQVVWHATVDLSGKVIPDARDLPVQRGFAGEMTLSELLTERPPTIFFFDGRTVHGSVVYNSRARTAFLPAVTLTAHQWDGVDITAETASTAARRDRGMSIHEALEDFLKAQPRRGRHRWIIANDGKGEIADYLVLEVSGNEVYLALWHAKASGSSTPGVRVTDFQEAIAQAIKSRKWITDVRLWAELGDRLNGRSSPKAAVVEGNRFLLDVLCGEHLRWDSFSFRRRTPIVRGDIGIVQPGLSSHEFTEKLRHGRPELSVTQTRDLLTVLHDSTSFVAQTVTVICSP